MGESDQVEAIERLLAVGDAEGLSRYLAADERNVRASAASALGQLECPSAIPYLVEAIGDQEVQVRQAAATALTRIGEEAIPALEEKLKWEPGRLTPYALWALGEIGSPAAIGVLVDAIQSASWRIRWTAAESLGNLGGRQAIDVLIQTLGDRDERVRNAAVEALLKIGEPAVDPLATALRNPRSLRRQIARLTLARMHLPAAKAVLRREKRNSLIPVLVVGIGIVLILAWLLSIILW